MSGSIITKAHRKDKVIDFRDGLVPSTPENYAAMHQEGGRKTSEIRSYPSVIKLYLCDFTRGTGSSSVNVSVNIEPSLCYEWLEVCKASLGKVAIPLVEKPRKGADGSLMKTELGKAWETISAADRMARSFGTLLHGLVSLLAAIVRGNAPMDDLQVKAALGSKLKNAMIVMDHMDQEPRYLEVDRGINYSYSQDKVNIYRRQSDGYAPVTRLSVYRQSLRTDGDAATYPWTFKITNGEAVVVERTNGATTFQANTLRNSREAFILVSDRDVFRMMLRVTHFIDAWESTYCIGNIAAGIHMREQESRRNWTMQTGEHETIPRD